MRGDQPRGLKGVRSMVGVAAVDALSHQTLIGARQQQADRIFVDLRHFDGRGARADCGLSADGAAEISSSQELPRARAEANGTGLRPERGTR